MMLVSLKGKRGTQSRSRSVIRSYGCDQKGRRLSWETGVEEVGFEVFPEWGYFLFRREKSSKELGHSD